MQHDKVCRCQPDLRFAEKLRCVKYTLSGTALPCVGWSGLVQDQKQLRMPEVITEFGQMTKRSKLRRAGLLEH